MALQIIRKVRNEGRKFLLEPEAKAVCLEYGIPVTKFKTAKTVNEAIGFSEKIGYPVVLKIVSPDVIHKSDVGGVALNLKDSAQVGKAFSKILKNVKGHKSGVRISGILVQEMAPPATEVIIGAIRDSQFGQTLMFGLGGIFVEVLKDVTFRIAPISKEDAYEMIPEVRAYPLLKSFRGRPSADIDAIAQILVNISRLVMDYPEIRELDLNPILVYEKGAKTVDARIDIDDP